MRDTIITCNVCQDLIPLVKDEVASEDSRVLVMNHIANCAACNAMYQEELPSEPVQELDDRRNLLKIKKKLTLTGLFILILGAFLGVYLSDSAGVFYNFAIMPFVGAFGYILLKRKWFILPAGVFALSYLWLFTGYIIDTHSISCEAFTTPLFFTVIYTFLTLLGILIGALLKFAFKKES